MVSRRKKPADYGYGKCPKCKKIYDTYITRKGSRCPKCDVELKAVRR